MAEVTPTNSLIPGGNQSTIDPQTVNVIQRNSFLLGTVSSQIANISAQMGAVSQSLVQVQQTISQNTFLEQQRQANEQKRQDLLAQEAARVGAESRAESRILNAVTFPVRRIAGKVQFSLQRLMNAFSFLFGGWLLNTFIESIRAKFNGNIGLMQSLQQTLRKGLITFGVVLAISLAGIGTVIGGIARLGAKIGSMAVRGLIIRPLAAFLRLISNLASKAWAGLAGGGLKTAGALTAGGLATTAMRKPGLLGTIGKVVTKNPWVAAATALGGFGLYNWMQGDQAQQAGLTAGPDGGITQTVSKGNQWWDFLGMVPDGTEQVQVDPGQVSEMLQITKTPWMYNEEQVIEAENFLKDPAGSGGTVTTGEEITPNKKEGNRGFLGWRSSLDWMTGGLTDFDNKGSEGNLLNSFIGNKDVDEIGPVEEPPPQIIEIPAVNTSGLFPGGGGGNTRGPVNTTPNISSNDSNNIYSMAAQTNFNVVSV